MIVFMRGIACNHLVAFALRSRSRFDAIDYPADARITPFGLV
jgi:hypothetical protein